jgi:glycosyltransferase involved in cell wall biosynthesis
MPTPRTVVHFVDSNTFGGCEEIVLSLLAGLDRRKWRPILFHCKEPGIDRLVDAMGQLGIPCRTVPRAGGWRLAATVRHFVRELRAAQPSIFHAHLNWPLGCRHGIMAAGLCRVPAIVATSQLYSSILGVRFPWLKQRLQAAAVDRYIAVSNEVKARLCGDLGVSESKVRVVRNGIRLAQFNLPPDAALRATLTQGGERPIVLTAARLHSQKGHVYLLEAAAHVPDALFVLAGEGPERATLERQAQQLGIQGRVRFLGHRQGIPQLLASCDVFVLPSLYEGLPLCVLEAMAAGKPVVATAVGGTDEVVIDGETGLLVPPGNPVALATAIRSLLSDRKLAARLAQAGRARVTEKFSSDTMVSGISRVYEEALGEVAGRATVDGAEPVSEAPG